MARFRDALARPGLQAIAEVKRRSPSMGALRPGADPAELAARFAAAGAAAISVLVDARFDGTIDDLRAARAATDAPLLGKGFFTSEEQILELKQAGADAILLLLRDLDDAQAAHLQDYARSLGLDALVEAHDAEEVERGLRLNPDMFGINCRNLTTFELDRGEQLRLLALVPPRAGRVLIAESGVHTRAQGAATELCGADAILCGTALMQAPDPAAKLKELLSRPLVKVCGLTREEDVAAAVEAGADLLGFVLAEGSPRRAPSVLPTPDGVLSVAVWVGTAGASGADLDQVHEAPGGGETVRGRGAQLLRRDGTAVARVLDLPWEGSDPQHWENAARAARAERVMLAGGLGPDNVRAAIDAVRPWAVDAARSLESAPGIKDHDLVRSFVEAAR